MTPCSYGRDTQTPCRSRLAGEEARKPCIALKDLFAGKPSSYWCAGGAQGIISAANNKNSPAP